MATTTIDKVRDTMRGLFDEFNEKHPEVYNMFVRFADEIRSSGCMNIGVDDVTYRVRWELLVGGDPELGRDAKIVFGNFYAQRLMAEEDGYKKFFDLIFPYGE